MYHKNTKYATKKINVELYKHKMNHKVSSSQAVLDGLAKDGDFTFKFSRTKAEL